MKIQRISFRKVGDDVREYKKLVLTKIDDSHYLTQAYIKMNGQWIDAGATSIFDGENVINGVVHFAHDGVDTKFKLLIEYEHYSVVEE